jgi:hypothetical protein
MDRIAADREVGLMRRAIHANGGARFESAGEVVIRGWSGGLAWLSKRGRAFGDFEARCSTREQRTELVSYPRKGQRGVFDRSGVRIESSDGAILAERSDPREHFPGGRRLLRWDELDVLYFAGYAIWGYACCPFVFDWPGFETRELDPWNESGERWERLEVTFPEEVDAHSRLQTFYFDERSLLRRIDYDPEVFGKWVHSAHLCEGHRDFDGFVFPTRRRVRSRSRGNRVRRFPNFIRIDVSAVELRTAEAARVASSVS